MKEIAITSALILCAMADENLLEVYKNQSFLHQNFTNQKSSFSINLPENINQNDIDVSASCELRSIILKEPELIKNKIYEQYEADVKKLSLLNNKLVALDEKFKFITITNPIKVSNVENVKSDSDKFYDAVLQNLNEQTSLKEEIKELNKKINAYNLKKIKKADLDFECDPKFVKISYPVKLSINTQNKVLADTTKSKIYIEQNLVVKNPLSIDINNLTIVMYPFYYSSNLTPPKFNPWYEGKPEPERSSARMMQESVAMMPLDSSSKRAYSSDIESQNIQNTLANVWKISRVNLKADEESVFNYDKQNLDAKFEIVIDGYSGSNAYIKANFIPLKSIEYALATFKIDGVSIGKASNFKAEPNSESHVYFGKNDLINVKKEKNTNFTKESFFGAKSKILEGYNYEVKNNSNSAWSVTLIDRLPVPTHESVSVSTKNNPKESEISKKGEISWKFYLNPSESKHIEFSYELTKPSK
ncbi:DUF4139 domain-containing protein [Campylobacter sp. RM16187]|uniref:DUF4139 domain-containing protein n=1 Tax=Campylobacter sp. RM16187 TaxID=1660063 RepID=UPI0021B66A74|nr:DUF4139 domain-containing protein [Campylobacter sp. RM16187]QKG28886.1 putative DUF4139 domain protein [Campylobacter sp. RM16187]